MRHFLWWISPITLAVSSLWAGPCPTIATPLSTYTAGGFTCTVGPVLFENFSFTVQNQSVSPPPTIAAANQINVTAQTTGEFGLNFAPTSPAVFTETGGQSVTYLLDYVEDPTGSIDSLDDFFADPVNFPGRAEVDVIGCLGGTWTAFNVCSAGVINETANLQIFDTGSGCNVGPPCDQAITFAGQQILGVQTTILIQGGGGAGSATLDGFGRQNVVPEPGTFWMIGMLVPLGFLLKARLKRAQIRL